MSKYTVLLRNICESLVEDRSNIENVINQARPKIFDFSYPLFDNTYKPILETKILKHFYFREIGFETYNLWKFYLNETLNLIMPYYNQLYKSELLSFNPFYDVDLTRQTAQTNQNDQTRHQSSESENLGNTVRRNQNESQKTSKTTNNSENSNTEWNLFSNTPQGGLEGIEGTTQTGLKYLTNATKNTNDASQTSDETLNDISSSVNTDNAISSDKNATVANENINITNLAQYGERVIGKQGTASYSKLLLEFRDTFLNIDALILDELNDLFFMLW